MCQWDVIQWNEFHPIIRWTTSCNKYLIWDVELTTQKKHQVHDKHWCYVALSNRRLLNDVCKNVKLDWPSRLERWLLELDRDFKSSVKTFGDIYKWVVGLNSKCAFICAIGCQSILFKKCNSVTNIRLFLNWLPHLYREYFFSLKDICICIITTSEMTTKTL